MSPERNPDLPPSVILDALSRIAAVVGTVCLLAEFGFSLTGRMLSVINLIETAVVGLFVCQAMVRLVRSRDRKIYAKTHWIELSLVSWVLIEGAVFVLLGRTGPLSPFYVAGVQVFLLANLGLWVARAHDSLSIRPPLILVGSYAALIATGTGVLLMPNCHPPGVKPWSFLDALFTATSAVCVTGLTVRDTGADLSIRGQGIVLFLIQAGGLGLATLAMFLTFVQRRSFQLRQSTALRDLLNLNEPGGLGGFLGYVLVITFLVEAAGAAILYAVCPVSCRSEGERLWWAVFHAVSAFCNAGFGLLQDSFESLSADRSVCLTLIALVVIGGLGFPVLKDLLQYRLSGLPIFRRFKSRRGVRSFGSTTRLRLHTKLVLVGTAILLSGGALLFLIGERNGVLAERDLSEAILMSIFHPAMARTAGFNSISITALSEATVLFLLLQMIVGAGPVSTGGGVKVSTVSVLWLTARSMLHHRERVEVFGRSVPRRVVTSAVGIVVVYGFALLVVVSLLLASQEGIRFRDVVFESVSALSTVGLSTGATATCDGSGRVILCCAMFVGRVGPLAVLLSMMNRPSALRFEYPEEDVLIS